MCMNKIMERYIQHQLSRNKKTHFEYFQWEFVFKNKSSINNPFNTFLKSE